MLHSKPVVLFPIKRLAGPSPLGRGRVSSHAGGAGPESPVEETDKVPIHKAAVNAANCFRESDRSPET